VPNLTEQTSTTSSLPANHKPTPVTDATQSERRPVAVSGPTYQEAPLKKSIIPRRIMGGLFFIATAAVTTLVILWFAPQIQRFQQYGYPGVFLTSLIGNASIALPIPSLAVTFAMGAVLNWVIVGLVSGIGEALGESTGYLAGYGGSVMIEDHPLYRRMKYWMERYGMATIFVLSVVPNPLIDLAGIAAGASRHGYFKFLFACWAGKTIKTLIFAWAGANSITWLMQFL
jgi:membrane protein DedA with SNARE-associated domain